MQPIYDKVFWLEGQGTTGVGSTKFIIEFSKLFREKTVVNYESAAKYVNAKNFSFDGYGVFSTRDIITPLKDADVVFVNSLPSDKSTFEEIDSFYSQLLELKKMGKKVAVFMHFNTMAFFNKMPMVFRGLNIADIIFTFDVESEQAEAVKKYIPHKASSLRAFQLPYEFSEASEAPAVSGRQVAVTHAGRYASFKQPHQMYSILKELGDEAMFRCIGFGRTIETKTYFFSPFEGLYKAIGKKVDTEEELGKVNCHLPMKNSDVKKFLSSSMFAHSGYFLKKKSNYGKKTDYAMMEKVDCRCVCVFDEDVLKHLGVDGSFPCKIDGDYKKLAEVMRAVIKMSDEERSAIVEEQVRAFKTFTDPVMVVSSIIKEVEESGESTALDEDQLYISLIGKSKSEAPNAAIDIPEAKKKGKALRFYSQKGTKTVKIAGSDK